MNEQGFGLWPFKRGRLKLGQQCVGKVEKKVGRRKTEDGGCGIVP